MPKQRPAESNQSVATPWLFIKAACLKLRIPGFNVDLAASQTNAKSLTGAYIGEAQNSLTADWNTLSIHLPHSVPPWNWLNPPFANIYPWAEKCYQESLRGAWTALLVPAAVDTDWWNDCVHGYGYVLALRSRIVFEGHTQGYPKGLALILYTPIGFNGMDLWDWREELKQHDRNGTATTRSGHEDGRHDRSLTA